MGYVDNIPEFLQPDLPTDYVLSSVFEIENVMLHLEELGKRLEHLKGLKKYRAQTIDKQIHTIESDVDYFRNIILRTMQKANEKTLQFPDVGKVSRRKVGAGWSIENENDLIAFFESRGEKDAVVKVKEVLDVRVAKKLAETYIESGVTVPGVAEIPESESISISFEKEDAKPQPKLSVKPKNKAAVDTVEFNESEL